MSTKWSSQSPRAHARGCSWKTEWQLFVQTMMGESIEANWWLLLSFFFFLSGKITNFFDFCKKWLREMASQGGPEELLGVVSRVCRQWGAQLWKWAWAWAGGEMEMMGVTAKESVTKCYFTAPVTTGWKTDSKQALHQPDSFVCCLPQVSFEKHAPC